VDALDHQALRRHLAGETGPGKQMRRIGSRSAAAVSFVFGRMGRCRDVWSPNRCSMREVCLVSETVTISCALRLSFQLPVRRRII
jgi:hypothetical protein